MYLVVIDEFLQFIGMYDNMQATHLGEPELLPLYTSKTHLKEKTVMSNNVFLYKRVDSALFFS